MHQYSKLHAFLTENEASPKKSLSQNFLIDGNIIRKIAHYASIQTEEIVIEIGPGPGALTEELLKRGAIVLAVEKDTRFATALGRFNQTYPERLEVFHEDVLKWNLAQAIEKYRNKPIKIVSNLPYHLTSPILGKLLPFGNRFASLTLMVQDEVARRITANSHSKDYGSLSVFCQYYTKPTYGFSVSPTCFFPAPKVTSAVIQLLPQFERLDQADSMLFYVRKGFQQRRKMIRVSLRQYADPVKIAHALKSINIKETARPEELSVEQWVAFAKTLLRDD